MAKLPGYAGMTLVGDKSVEFYRDAMHFVEKRMQQFDSPIFLSRLLNKPTAFIASNAGVQEVLNDKSSSLELGYRSFMLPVYGDNIVFANGAEADELRQILHGLFTSEALKQFQTTIEDLTIKSLEKIKSGEPVCVYSIFKRLATEICLSIFLDISFEKSHDLAEHIVALTTTHWHGIISVPMNLRIPMLTGPSWFGKAIEAKEELLKIIEKKLSESTEGFPQKVKQCKFPAGHDARNHILLFTSALVPKALASLLTSFAVQLGNNERLQDDARDTEALEHILLEVQRLYPPFLGGRRLVRQDIKVSGYKIPSGHAIVYMTRQAQRDPAIFHKPNEFIPSRWKNSNAHDRDKLFLFGSGPRSCVGRQLVDNILKVFFPDDLVASSPDSSDTDHGITPEGDGCSDIKSGHRTPVISHPISRGCDIMTVTTNLLSRFTWRVVSDQDLQYKWLPVSRPTQDAKVIFTRR